MSWKVVHFPDICSLNSLVKLTSHTWNSILFRVVQVCSRTAKEPGGCTDWNPIKVRRARIRGCARHYSDHQRLNSSRNIDDSARNSFDSVLNKSLHYLKTFYCNREQNVMFFGIRVRFWFTFLTYCVIKCGVMCNNILQVTSHNVAKFQISEQSWFLWRHVENCPHTHGGLFSIAHSTASLAHE